MAVLFSSEYNISEEQLKALNICCCIADSCKIVSTSCTFARNGNYFVYKSVTVSSCISREWGLLYHEYEACYAANQCP